MRANQEQLYSADAAAGRLVEALRAYLPLVMAKHQTPGLNIALADRGQLIWEAGYGHADIATGRLMTPDTTFHSGSLGKVYTATAVMILVDRGVISLDDPISRHLPFAVHNPLGVRDITVRDLMVHKSGLGDDAALSLWSPGADLAHTLKEEYSRDFSPMFGGSIVPRWINHVGAQWHYSNLGVATLGLIVEHANPDGLTFSRFMQREVIEPLGMTLTQMPTAQHPDHVRPDIWALASTGYSRMGHADIPSFPLCFGEYPAGGVMGRPADFIRLALAMLNDGELDGHRLFSPETTRLMLSPATAVERGSDGGETIAEIGQEQGLMWRLGRHTRPERYFRHDGGHMWGWRTEGRAWPEYGAAVMVASNQWSQPDDSADAIEIAEFIGNWLAFRPTVDASLTARINPRALSFARGLWLATAYCVTLGIPGDPPAEQLDAIISGTRDRGGDWDADAFRRGFQAGAALPRTRNALGDFLKSTACEIDPSLFRSALVAFGGREPTLATLD